MGRSARIRAWAESQGHLSAGLGGAVLIVGSLAAMVLLLARLMSAGKLQGTLDPSVWALVAVLGLGFVHCQSIATALLVSLATRLTVTGGHNTTSVSADRRED